MDGDKQKGKEEKKGDGRSPATGKCGGVMGTRKSDRWVGGGGSQGRGQGRSQSITTTADQGPQICKRDTPIWNIEGASGPRQPDAL